MAENKNIANLNFNIEDAMKKLDKVNQKLKEISDSSENYTKKISNGINGAFQGNSIINSGDVQKELKVITGYVNKFGSKMKYTLNGKMDFAKLINVDAIKKDLGKVDSIGEKNAKNFVNDIMKQELSLTTRRKKNASDLQLYKSKKNIEMLRQESKTNDKILEYDAYKNMKIELQNNQHQNKMEEINSRQLESTKTLYDKINEYAKTYLIYQGFNQLRKAINETTKEMVDMEYQMIQIDRVLNEDSLNIDSYRDNLIQLAYDYGNSFENVSDVTLRLAQAGFDSNESLQLTEKTLLALNTAELDATDATSGMVSIMSQWGYMTGDAREEAEKYGNIIDKINKVADNYPTTSKDILEALKKTSSAFNLAGASIDETIATIVAAEKASQRGGKVIGTALSNIAQQIRAPQRLKLAEEMGLDFFEDDAKTKFKPMLEIFAQMSERMEKLKKEGKESSVEMQGLLEMFTIFRRNIGASLLGEMSGETSTYAKVLNDSINSVGYSLQENAKHMGTAKAAQAQFNAELLKLKTEVWDQGLENVFRAMLDMGVDLSKGISKIIETFGALPTILGAATLAFSILSKKMKVVKFDAQSNTIAFTGMFKGFSNLKNNIREINALQNALRGTAMQGNIAAGGFKSLIVNLTAYSKKATVAAMKTMLLKSATVALNLAAGVAATAGVMLLSSIVQELTNKYIKATEAQKQAISSTEELVQKQESETDSLKGLISEYEKLGKKEKRTPEDVTKLYEIQSKIKGILGEQASTIDLINGKYEEQIEILGKKSLEEQRKLVEEKKKLKEQKESEGIGYSLPSFVEKTFGDKDYEKILNERNELIDGSLKKTLENKNFDEIKDLLTHWEKSLRPIQSESLEVANTYSWVTNLLNQITKSEEEAGDAAEDYVNELAKLKIQEMFPEGSINNVEDFNNALKSISEGSFDVENVQEFKDILTDLISNEYPKFVNQIEVSNGSLEDADESILNTLNSLQEMANSYASLEAAQQEYNSTGEMTISTLQGLINNDLLQYLSIQDGELQINAQSMLDLAEAKKVEAIEALQSAAANDIQKAAMGDTKNMSSIAKGAIAQFGSNSEKAGSQAQSASAAISNLAASMQAVAKAQEGKLGEGVDLETFKAQADAIANSYKNIANNIGKIKITGTGYSPRRASGGGSHSGGRSSGSSARAEADRARREAERAAEEARRAEEKAYKEKLKRFEDFLKDKERAEKRWVDKQEELGLLSNQDYLYITKERIERHKKYLEEIKRQTWLKAEDRLELEKEYSEKIEDLQLDYMGYLKEKLEDDIKALEDANEKKIDLIDEEADKKIQALKKVEKETDRIREKEEYQKRRQEHLNDISYWEQRTGREAQEALKEAKKNLQELDDEWKKQQEDWSVEDQIKAIEEERDAQIKAIEEAQKQQIKAWEDTYQAKVKLFSETGQIIYENTVIQSQALYEAYKNNFVDPLSRDLANLNNNLNPPVPVAPPAQAPVQRYETYTIKYGDTLSGIASKFGTTIEKIMAANPYIKNKNRIYSGKTLQIPKFHEGGIVGGNKEGFALLKPNEVVLKPEWADGINKLAKMAKNKENPISNSTVIEVKGDLVRIDANIKNKGDAEYLTRKVEKVLRDKFNIKK